MARLPKSIIKKYGITKKAWQVFRGRAGRVRRRIRRPRRTRRRRTNPGRKRGGRRMVRRYRRKRRRGGKSILRTGFKLIRLGALAAPGIGVALRTDLSPQAKIDGAFRMYTGYEMSTGRWKFEWLASGWLPYIGACLATYGIPKLTSILRRL